MASLWRQIGPYWHILTGITGIAVAAVLWANDVSGYGNKIDKNSEDIRRLKSAIIRIDYNTQQTAQKIGVKPLLPPRELE